jgi:hypothetical protein
MTLPLHPFRYRPAAFAVPVLALATAVAVRGFNPQPDPPAIFGLVGITLSETARISAVVRGGGAVLPAPAGCRVAFSYLAADGRVLKQETKTILAGHAAYLDLTGVEALPPGPIAIRTGIRPVVEVAAAQSSADVCHAVAGLEMYDNATGRTNLLVVQPPPVGDRTAATASTGAAVSSSQ